MRVTRVISTWLMVGLVAASAAIMVAAVCERNWWRALYFFGAILITVAVLGMSDKR